MKEKTQREVPFRDLLTKLEESLKSIEFKTQAFQVDYPREELKDCIDLGTFGNELYRIVELAEYIDSKIKL